ncbi:hypothetical protein P692DRAFT_201850363 [Suillus brevipes Sb2]|nr:hypothetical protein P692DRAFT_201850363 [Suillus brevipes Sb2]
MASACSFHGVVGFQNATCYALEPKKAFWKMDGFVPVSPDPENGIGDLPVFLSRPAYATTYNGCQGFTLEKAVLDLRTDSFAHGQLYIAVSTARGALVPLYNIGDLMTLTAGNLLAFANMPDISV